MRKVKNFREMFNRFKLPIIKRPGEGRAPKNFISRSINILCNSNMFVKPQYYTNQGRHFTLSELDFITALVEDTSSNLPCVNA